MPSCLSTCAARACGAQRLFALPCGSARISLYSALDGTQRRCHEGEALPAHLSAFGVRRRKEDIVVLLANLCVDDDGTPCHPELAAQTANKNTLHVVLQVAQVLATCPVRRALPLWNCGHSRASL